MPTEAKVKRRVCDVAPDKEDDRPPGHQQIRRVKALSDADQLKLGDRDVMVAYLIEVTPKDE